MHFVTDEPRRWSGHSAGQSAGFTGDSEDEITARVQTQEHAIYPLVVSWFMDGRLRMEGNQARLDNAPLPPQGHAAEE